MQSFLREYVLSVAVTGVIMGIMESLLPEGKLRRVAHLALALVMLAAMVAPLARLGGVTLSLEADIPAMSSTPGQERQTYEDVVRGVLERHYAREEADKPPTAE